MGGADLEPNFICNLKTLSLNSCKVECGDFDYKKYVKEIDNSMPDWVSLFLNCPHLEELDLSNSGLSHNHFESLRALLDKGQFTRNIKGNSKTHPQVDKIRTLLLSKNPTIQKEGAESLQILLPRFTSLEKLALDFCKLGVAGAIHINDFITENKTLKVLNLASNKIEVDGARHLAKSLQKNTSLEYIDLAFCKIRDEGFKKIGEGLASNPDSKLKSLVVRNNMLSD